MKLAPKYTRCHVGHLPIWAVSVVDVGASDVDVVDNVLNVPLSGRGGWTLTKRGARKMARRFEAEFVAERAG
jgi:hypothetical protein